MLLMLIASVLWKFQLGCENCAKVFYFTDVLYVCVVDTEMRCCLRHLSFCLAANHVGPAE